MIERNMGTVQVQVTGSLLDPNIALKAVSDAGNGAQLLFVGVVRNLHQGKTVHAVTYDAFVPLAEKTLGDIAREVQEKFGKELGIYIAHRTGRLEVGVASVMIAIGAPHRQEVYDASRYVIEQIKVRVPIWKKEHYETGESEWLPGHELSESNS